MPWNNSLNNVLGKISSRVNTYRNENCASFLQYCYDVIKKTTSYILNISHSLKYLIKNKANLRDLIAATGLVILLKFDPSHWCFSPWDLEIWWMTSKNHRAPLLYYIKLCASFQIHWWIKTEVTVRKRSIWVKIGNFLSRVTLKFDGWPWKTIGHLFYTTSIFVHHFKAMGELNLKLQWGNAQFGSKLAIYCLVWPWNLMDDLG